MNVLQLLLGQIPEAIYFALFMIFTKRLDKKQILFTILMIIEYILLFNFTPVTIWSHISYFIITYMILRLLYNEKSQITDIFTLGIASILVIIISMVSYIIVDMAIKDIIVCNILAKIMLFIILYFSRNKLYKIQNMYKKFWNRNDKIPKPMKSTTFRCINLVLFNIMFFIINNSILFYMSWR